MHKKQSLIFISIILLLTFNLFGQSENRLFFNIKANLSMASNPIFFVQNVSNKTNMSQSNKWLLIEIEYKSFYQRQKGSLNNSSNELNRNFDIKFEAILPGVNQFFYLSTIINYATVSFNKDTKYAMALMPPQIVRRIVPSSRNSNAYLKDINLRVTFQLDGKNEAIYYYPQRSMTENAFNNILNSKNTVKIPGGLLNRMQSPWSVIDYNRYEIIRQ